MNSGVEDFPVADNAVRWGEENPVAWIDLCAPTAEDFAAIGAQVGLRQMAVEGALHEERRSACSSPGPPSSRPTKTLGSTWEEFSLAGRAALVLDAMSDSKERPPVYGVLCFVGADWALLAGTSTVKEIMVAWPAAVVKPMCWGGSSSGATQAVAGRAVMSRTSMGA